VLGRELQQGDGMSKKDDAYEQELYELQVELVKLQRELIADRVKVLVIVEGRDAAGKDGTIKRLTAHMSPRETRVFAPSKPSDRETTQWYFQRFIPQLPSGGEFVIFNRSWYNRAGVERVMGFCTEDDVKEFFATVDDFEKLLVRSGISLRKYYLEISKEEQKERLAERQTDPLKAWKNSPIDAAARKKWDEYTAARDDMLRHTSHDFAPWRIVHANKKQKARLELMRDLLDSFEYKGKKKKLTRPDRAVVFKWSKERERELAR
jgi:polyphosphate kinase 2